MNIIRIEICNSNTYTVANYQQFTDNCKMSRCEGFTKNGERCKKNARQGSHFCAIHTDQVETSAHNSHSDDEVSAPVSAPVSAQVSTSQVQPVLMYPPAPVRVQLPTASRSMSVPQSVSKPSAPTYSIGTTATNSSSYSNIEDRIDAIEETIRKLVINVNGGSVPRARKPRVPKPMTEEKALEKAKFIFYHDNKKDANILERVRNGLSQGNMLVFKAKKKGDTITHEPNIHWMLVKDATDVMFDALSAREKEVYIRRAWDAYAQKIGNV